MTRRRKFWGWGYEDQTVGADEEKLVVAAFGSRFGADDLPCVGVPRVEEFSLPRPRLAPPAAIEHLVRAEPHERLCHAYGKSFPDGVRIFQRHVPSPPDLVAYPESEQDVIAILDWLDGAGAAAIPFGGGTSVVGGVEPAVGDDYAAAVSIDMTRMGAVKEIDRSSRAALIEAGALGPALEGQLRPHKLTLRHFPQSFEFSTLGGWIATRSGGHFASRYTHIDDFVESVRMVTPKGTFESYRLPGSGAGPSPDRLVIGSEGILGIITQAWMRLQDAPTFRESKSIRFPNFHDGAEAVRRISQAALYPSNCRLIDADEALATGAGDGSASLLVLAFEGADHPLSAWMARALEICRDCGGEYNDGRDTAGSHRSGAAGEWRNAFIRAPFYREILIPRGIIVDTFETAITWDRFRDFHDGVKRDVEDAIREVTGRPGAVTCRFTHIYPDGPAPYFTFQGLGRWDGIIDQWRQIKAAASEAIVSRGGTITHHHAVGRDHRPWYQKQVPEPFIAALRAAKAAVDPQGILNPGVLIDPDGRFVGTAGAMAGY